MTFRFAVLHHILPPGAEKASHWDLLLEQPDPTPQFDFEPGLWTFEVSIPPEKWGPSTCVRKLPNHRKIYLDFQGAVSGDRGEVVRVLSGVLNWQVVEKELLILQLKSNDETSLDLHGILNLSARILALAHNQWDMELMRD